MTAILENPNFTPGMVPGIGGRELSTTAMIKATAKNNDTMTSRCVLLIPPVLSMILVLLI